MNSSIAAVIIGAMFSATALFGMGAFSPSRDYATVSFNGGYQKLGVIYSQRTFTKATVTLEGRAIFAGNFEKVISEIQDALSKSSSSKEQVTWKEGVHIIANTGVSWTGSQSNFEMTVDTLDETSTTSNPLKPTEIVAKLKAMEMKIRAEHEKHAQDSLKWGSPPSESSGFLNILANLLKSGK